MVGDRRRFGGSLFSWLGAAWLACSNVDIAGTLEGEAEQGGTLPAAGQAGTSSVDREDYDAGGRLPSQGLTCTEGSQWLLFMRADPLAVLEPSEAIPDALELLYVEEDCTFWVVDSTRSGQIRSGTLERVQAQELWSDLGTDARAGLPRDEGTSRIGPVWMIKDGSDQLECLGQCVSESVDAGIRDLFETAGRWVQDLYVQGESFEGNVADIGLPVD
ncbi:MAG: hypothetical protein JW940_30490 [Polyangiaceae bacterium]|nr:hypothetical protein [Polyangiaceae bacterium]